VLGTLKLREVRAVHVQMLINKLHEDGYTHGTLKLLKSLLKEMFKMAMGNGYMLVNPCDAVILPKKESNEPRFLTEKEQAMFMEVAVEYQHYDIFCADLCSGMRIGELLGLKWSDIDFENKVIRIKRTLHYAKLKEEEACHFFFTTPKTETSERTIPMLPEMEVILRRVKSKQLRSRLLAGKKWNKETEFEDMVFTSQYGAPVRYGDVNRTIKLAVVKANIQEAEVAKYEDREPYVLKPFSPHCFRHTFVTRCKTKGIPYEVIKPYVGHSNTATTMYYDHTKEEIDMSKLQKVSFLGVV
jgi:integrase